MAKTPVGNAESRLAGRDRFREKMGILIYASKEISDSGEAKESGSSKK